MNNGFPTFETDPLVERTIERDRSLSTAVVETVASVSNSQVEDLPPLYDTIDPDVLDRAFERSNECLIAFPYNGYTVGVTGDRTIAVYRKSKPSASRASGNR